MVQNEVCRCFLNKWWCDIEWGGANLPWWFTTPQERNLHLNVIIILYASFISDTPTLKSRSYVVISSGKLHSDNFLTLWLLWTPGKHHRNNYTETTRCVSHVTGVETSSQQPLELSLFRCLSRQTRLFPMFSKGGYPIHSKWVWR